MAPVTIPHVIRAGFNDDLTTPTARARYASQLEQLFATPAATRRSGTQRTTTK